MQGAYLTARGVVAHDGIRGLYKGFGTVIGGMFPARMVRLGCWHGRCCCCGAAAAVVLVRVLPPLAVAVGQAMPASMGRVYLRALKGVQVGDQSRPLPHPSLPHPTLALTLHSLPPQVYLSTLEVSKSVTNSLLHRYDMGDTAAVGAASFVGGAMASLSSQLIVVPIDVVAQRLMIMGGGPPPGADPNARAAAAAEAAARHHTSGLALARSIVAAEGVRGLYRGFGASLAMFVPNSAIW